MCAIGRAAGKGLARERHERLRLLVAAFGDAGHAFPAIALARALAGRGHEVVVETWERWREPVEALGLRVHGRRGVHGVPAAGARRADGRERGGRGAGAGAADRGVAARRRSSATSSRWRRRSPRRWRGCRRATLIPHVYPGAGAGACRSSPSGCGRRGRALGRAVWRAALPVLETGLRQGRRELNETRARVGLAPLERFHGGISERLALVATFPQLEYPRRWPRARAGDRADGLRAARTRTSRCPRARAAGAGGAEHRAGPRVRAGAHGARGARRRAGAGASRRRTGTRPEEPIEVPANAVLVDWLCYTPGDAAGGRWSSATAGHGTVARALARVCRCCAARRSGTWRRTRCGSRGRAPGCRCRGGSAGRRRCAGGAAAARRPSVQAPGRRDRGVAAENDGAERGAELVEKLAAS